MASTREAAKNLSESDEILSFEVKAVGSLIRN